MPYIGKKPADIIATAVDTTTGTFSGAVSASSVDADGGVTVDNITIDGTEIDLSSGDLTIDVAGDITLDAGGGDVNFQDDGTLYGFMAKSSNDLLVGNAISDGDVTIRGNDGGSNISAVTFDMSNAGAASFNSYMTSTAVYGKDDGNTGIQFDGSDVITLHTGGAEHMKIDANGHITKPNQTAFLVQPSGLQTNFPINTETTLTYNVERFDVNSDFNTSTYTFTAPVTGKYHLSFNIYLLSIDHETSYFEIFLRTSNRTYSYILDNTFFDTDVNNFTQCFSVVADMDASDTAYVSFLLHNSGTAQMDLHTPSYFSGVLVC